MDAGDEQGFVPESSFLLWYAGIVIGIGVARGGGDRLHIHVYVYVCVHEARRGKIERHG